MLCWAFGSVLLLPWFDGVDCFYLVLELSLLVVCFGYSAVCVGVLTCVLVFGWCCLLLFGLLIVLDWFAVDWLGFVFGWLFV